MSVNHNDRASVKSQQAGRDGTWLRNLHQGRLGFTVQQFTLVRTMAQRLDGELKQLNANAPATPTQPPPPELKTLNQQREAVIATEVFNLKAALGSELAARLDAYVKARIAPRVTTLKKEVQQ